jgi:hypothetical protein
VTERRDEPGVARDPVAQERLDSDLILPEPFGEDDEMAP